MMSISQIDMVVWRDHLGELQVCGDLDPASGDGHAASSLDPQSFTVVVRQGDSVAALHVARPFDPKAFNPGNGRWELKGTLKRQGLFATDRPAVVSAVVVLKSEPGGLETLSWVQPVTIVEEEPATPLAGRAQLEFHPEVLAQPPERDLGIGHSVSSSLTILQNDASGGPTFSGLPRIDKLPPAVPHLP